MRIGFDVTSLCLPQSGVGTYTFNLLTQLMGAGDDEIVPLAHRPPLTLPNGSLPDQEHLRSQWPANKTLWMQTRLPRQLARLGIQICHFTNSVASLWSPCPTVITIHDMTLWLYPEYHYGLRLWSMRPLIPLAARRADAIIAVSEATRADIVRILGVPAAKVHVIHEAPAPQFRPLDDRAALAAVRAHYRLPDRYLLYVGTIEPRKNLVRLLQAYAQIRRAGPIDHKLVLVGHRGWKEQPVFAAIEALGLQDAVCRVGYVPLSDLVALYNLADALVFPSLYEGFGLPVIEAMACGTPVLTSRNGSLAEIAGDAAEFVEPSAVASIAAGLQRLLTDAGRRTELRERGLTQAARFSWSAAAQQSRQLYGRAVAERRMSQAI